MDEKVKRRAAAAAVTAAASAGVLVGGLFAAPTDLLRDAPAPVVDAAQAAQEEDGAQEERKGVKAGLRQRILRLPIGVRALVGVPLWGIGWALLTALSMVWTGLYPAAGALLGWLALALVMLAVFALSAKAMFPELPLRTILSRRSLLALAIPAVLLAVADAVAPTLWAEYPRFAGALRLTGSFLAVLLALWALAVRELRRRLKAERQRSAAPPTQEEIRRAAREIADSIR